MADGHVTLKRRIGPSIAEVLRPRHLAPSVLLFVLGAAVSLFIHNLEQSRVRALEIAHFQQEALQLTADLQSSFQVSLEVLHSLPAFFDASTEVSRSEFAAFCRRSLQRRPEIYALEWFPWVPAAERSALEQQARDHGVPGFQFTHVGPTGRMQRADDRNFYLPLFYMEPPNPTALGFDLASEPERRAPALEARDTGRPVVSQRIRLVEDPPSMHSFAVFSPVYQGREVPADPVHRRAAFRGVTALVARVSPVVERAIRGLNHEHAEFVLRDLDAPPALQLLYESAPHLAREFQNESDSALHSRSEFRLLRRRWQVDLRAPAPVTGYGHLLTGLGISLLLALFSLGATALQRLRRQMRQALRLGQYTLDSKIGEGGMAVVYRGHHTLLSRPTAIKLVSPREGEARLKRFEREAELTSNLTHPNTIVIYDYGRTADGTLYYVMEYLDGVTFDELVHQDGALPPSRVRHLLLQICGALEEAHSVGLIHRDIKPANLMLTFRGQIADFVKVLDFGLVKSSNPGTMTLSGVNAVLGTPGFLSPESILHPDQVDARSDLYSLGAVAYYLLTGSQVFEGDSIVEICVKHINDPPPPPAARLGVPVPESLSQVVMRCLEKDPGRRFQSAGELEAALEACDDVGVWSQADARDWWLAWLEERAHRSSQAALGSLDTVAIDLDRRRSRTTPKGHS